VKETTQAVPITAPRAPISAQILIWAELAAIAVIAWIWLLRMPMPMDAMPGMQMAMPMPHHWSVAELWLNFVMWSVMMVAMMLPSAAPMITMYARMVRPRTGYPQISTLVFMLGYLCVWTAFSAVATLLQFLMQYGAIIGDELRVTPIVGASILVAAGLFQLTSLKERCLAHCRSPLAFFMAEWRDGIGGAFSMGLHHGIYCVGCCWMLMALLFVAGVMNLLWVAAISAFVLLEKASRFGRPIARTSGIAMIAAAVMLVAMA